MSGHRHAAAALYGLARADRDGILAALPAGDQRILRNYMRELRELGFDPSAKLVMHDAFQARCDGDVANAAAPAVLWPALSKEHSTRSPAPPDARSRLHGAAGADVFAAVAHEPAALIAQLLALDTWPWAEALLNMLPQRRSTQVQMAIDAGVKIAPARADFLIAAVAERVTHTHPAPFGARIAALLPALSRLVPWTR